MSRLTTKIRRIVGKGRSDSGRGGSWMYVTGTADDRGRATIQENEDCINRMSEAFETWKLEQVSEFQEQLMVTFVSFVYDLDGEYMGSCKIHRWGSYEKDGDRFIVVDYTEQDRQSIERMVRESVGFQSFEKV